MNINHYDENYNLERDWNINKDYGNEYIQTHFRIEAGYEWGKGMNVEAYKRFNSEIKEILQPLGWEWEKGDKNRYTDGNAEEWGCGHISRNKEILYIHPMDISGEILKNSVKEIATVLENGKTFDCNRVDLYKEVYDITPDQYNDYLCSRKNEMKQVLFDNGKTKRTYKFKYADDLAYEVARKFKLIRVREDNDVRGSCDRQTYEFVLQLINEMAEDGYMEKLENPKDMVYAGGIHRTENVDYVRSLNKTELKNAKLKPVFV